MTKETRPSITYAEEGHEELVERALVMLGCKTAREKSRARAYMLASAGASIVRAGIVYEDWQPRNSGLNLCLSPIKPTEAEADLLERLPDSNDLTELPSVGPPAEDDEPTREVRRHKKTAFQTPKKKK